jgi:hypothetical protein
MLAGRDRWLNRGSRDEAQYESSRGQDAVEPSVSLVHFLRRPAAPGQPQPDVQDEDASAASAPSPALIE